MNKYYIIILLSVFCSCSSSSAFKERKSNSKKNSFIENQLQLSKKDFKSIKKKDSIINELYTSIKDTVSIALINRRLDSFLLKSYTKKEFLVTLQLDRAFKHKSIPIELIRSKTPIKTIEFKTAEEAANFDKKIIKSIVKNSSFKNTVIKDSTTIRKDSLN